jgi:hypothetical protein
MLIGTTGSCFMMKTGDKKSQGAVPSSVFRILPEQIRGRIPSQKKGPVHLVRVSI